MFTLDDETKRGLCFAEVPYRDFMEFRALSESFRADMQSIIRAKIESEFWTWRRRVTHQMRVARGAGLMLGDMTAFLSRLPSTVRFNLVEVMHAKLMEVTKERCPDWCRGVSVNLDSVLAHTTSAIFVFQLLQREGLIRVSSLEYSVQMQFQVALTEWMNMLMHTNFRRIHAVGMLTHEEIAQRQLAVLMAGHSRLGQKSELATLDGDLLREIARMSVS